MTSLPPRVVIVTRQTEYELLIARHATRDAVRFQLAARGETLDTVEERHEAQRAAVHCLRSTLPPAWRQAAVRRAELDRFLFQPGDLVAAVGQDGLIANVAKYVDTQPVLGINPSPASIDGVLVRFAPTAAAEVLAHVHAGRGQIERRTMVEARLDTGETLLALNEVFVGHRSHQSALYEIQHGRQAERHSSSGLIVSSGTGASGWACSIMAAIGQHIPIDPCAPSAAFFVREAWPSRTTGTALVHGVLDRHHPLRVTSRMEGGVVFADGIEQDFLGFDWGKRLSVGPSDRVLSLVVG